MTKFIVIASGKGGVGKTTTALNIGSALSDFGRDIILVDANISSPNIGVHLGKSHLSGTLHDVLKGSKSIKEIVYIHPSGLKVIPSSINLDDMEDTELEKLPEVVQELDGLAEVVIIDAAPGLHQESIHAIDAAEDCIIVTTPDMISITDAIRTTHVAKKLGKNVAGIVVNKVTNHPVEVSIKNIENLVGVKVIGVIPFDMSVTVSMHAKHPVNFSHPDSPSAVGFKKLAAYILGEDYEHPVPPKESDLNKFLKKMGIKE